MTFRTGDRVWSANGNLGTVTNVSDGSLLVSVLLDTGHTVTCLARLCTVAPYVIDPANLTDAEMAAGIQRGLSDGSLIDAADWMAANAPESHPFNDDGSDPGNCATCHFFHK